MSETTKERLTVNLPPELIERARNAVYWTPGDSGGLPLGVDEIWYADTSIPDRP